MSTYEYDGKVFPVYGNGEVARGNAILEAFYRLYPDLNNRIIPMKNYYYQNRDLITKLIDRTQQNYNDIDFEEEALLKKLRKAYISVKDPRDYPRSDGLTGVNMETGYPYVPRGGPIPMRPGPPVGSYFSNVTPSESRKPGELWYPDTPSSPSGAGKPKPGEVWHPDDPNIL